MSGKLADQDLAWAAKIWLVLEHWDGLQVIDGDWTVEYDSGDGAYRVAFTVRPNVMPGTGGRKRYNMTEAEFCMYVQGVADMAPRQAGPAGRRLADESREEVPR